jgi:L-lysine 2,3-aminomutase
MLDGVTFQKATTVTAQTSHVSHTTLLRLFTRLLVVYDPVRITIRGVSNNDNESLCN